MCKNSGQTLIEVLVALGTAVIVISAIVVSVISSLNNLNFGKNQNLATQYAQEGMEIMRRQRNTTTTFNTLSGEYCMGSSKTLVSIAGNCIASNDCAPPNINNTFIRRVCVNQNATSCLPVGQPVSGQTTQVAVEVFWSDAKCNSANVYCHESKLISCFVNSNSIQAP